MSIDLIIEKKYSELIRYTKSKIWESSRDLDPREVISTIYLLLKNKNIPNLSYVFKAIEVQIKSNNSSLNYIKGMSGIQKVALKDEYIFTKDLELKISLDKLMGIWVKKLGRRDENIFTIFYIKDNRTTKELKDYFKVSSPRTLRNIRVRGEQLEKDFYEFVKNNIEL